MRLITKLGFLVVLSACGLVSALVFRKHAAPVVTSPAESAATIERRVPSWSGKFQAATPRVQPHLLTASTGYVSEPAQQPELPPHYHQSFSPVGALLKPFDETGTDNQEDAERDDMRSLTEEVPSPPKRELTHKIVDGDTLIALAERYLGDGKRYQDLYEYNQDVLRSPDLLPIGRMIKIPPEDWQSRASLKSPAQAAVPEKPMVAIPRGAFRREEE